MPRQAMTNRCEDQTAYDSAAAVCRDKQSQVQSISKHFLDVNRLDDAAKDRIQKICQHDHDHYGQDQRIAPNETQPIPKFVKVISSGFLFFYMLRCSNHKSNNGSRYKERSSIQPQDIGGTHH